MFCSNEKSFHFLSRLKGQINGTREGGIHRACSGDSGIMYKTLVKGNITLISFSSQFITSSVPFLIKFSSVTLEPQTSVCWMLQCKFLCQEPALKVTLLQADRLPKKKSKIGRILFTSHTALPLKELHGKKIFLVFLVLQILYMECSLSWLGSVLGLSAKPGLCMLCWFGVFPSFCFSVRLKEPGIRCLLGRHPDSVNMFDFRGRLKIKLFCVTSSIIRPGCVASYGILFQKWLRSMR